MWYHNIAAEIVSSLNIISQIGSLPHNLVFQILTLCYKYLSNLLTNRRLSAHHHIPRRHFFTLKLLLNGFQKVHLFYYESTN